ncbi:MAG TPA: 2-phosphosulfolactate phosphatase [Acidimicrobiales bacterium]
MIPQDGFAYRFDWGADGLAALAPAAAVLVLVDVLRFSTAVSVAVERGVSVVPGRWEGATRPWTLSPRWIREHPGGSRLELTSANGAVLAEAAVRAGARVVLTACFRNASAVARAAARLAAGGPIAVVAAGEEGRPAVEDLLGAGAVLAALDPSAAVSAPACSPDAAAARAAFVAARPRLAEVVAGCDSARELAARAFGDDVTDAAALDVSTAVPILRDGAFVAL